MPTGIILALVIIGLLMIVAGLLWLLFYSYAVRMSYRLFGRPQPRPPYDKSPLTIDQNTIFGRGQNWFYSNRMNILDWQMTSFDGLKLAASYIPAAKNTTRDVVILLHGFNDAPSVMAAYAQLHLEKRDCHILIPHMRAHGMSEGDFVGYGLFDSQDIAMWMQYLETRLGPDLRIVLHGRSMGAATAIITAGAGVAPDTLQGVIADCSFDTLDHQFSHLCVRKYRFACKPFLSLVKKVAMERFGFPVDKCSPLAMAPRISVPVLLFHGTEDDLVPSEMSDNIFNALRAPKRICLIEGAEHCMAYNDAPEQYATEIDKFRDSLSDNEWQRLIGKY